MNAGWIKLHRCIMDKGYFKKPEYVALWAYLLLRANHDHKEVFIDGGLKPLKPGQFVTSRLQISVDTGIEQSKVERILKCFQNEHQIEQQSSTKYRIISIVNWQKYQESEQHFEQQVNSKRTASEQQVNTDKNERMKEKKEHAQKFNPPSVEEVKAYCRERGNNIDAQYFHDHYEARGWIPKGYKSQMKNWKAAVRTWERNPIQGGVKPVAVVVEDLRLYRQAFEADNG